MKRLRTDSAGGFSLVEVLVSLGIIMLIVLVLVSMVNSTCKTWTYTSSRIEQFRDARNAFETVSRQLAQATLNTYWDYVDANGQVRGSNESFEPARYVRQSNLRFISGPALLGNVTMRPTHSIFFQAPLGVTEDANYTHLGTMLNTLGYFIEFGSDKDLRPDCINEVQGERYQHRYRLKEVVEPTESLSIYKYTANPIYNGKYTGTEWLPVGAVGTSSSCTRVLADNVIALILLPKLGLEEAPTKLSPQYSYNSTETRPDASINPKNQLPPVVQMTVVAIDETSAARLATQYGTAAPDFGLDGLFATAENYTKDLQTLETTLTQRRIGYRVFTTDVIMKAAKWSQEQSN